MNWTDKIIPITTTVQRNRVRKYLKKKRKKRGRKQRSPEKLVAWQILKNARRDGLIKPQPCQVCNADEGVSGHHYDYYHPFDVIWVCRPCHNILDKGIHLVRDSRHEAI